MEFLTEPATWLSLITLTAMEIVLGIDNVIFISILVDKLPAGQQAKARKLGLGLALVLRLGLLFAITWVMGLTTPLFSVFGKGFTGRDLILLAAVCSSSSRRRARSTRTSRSSIEDTRRLRADRHSGSSSSRSWCWTSCSRSTR